MRMRFVVALFGSIAVSACVGSPATLAIPPDFELETPSGIASVSIRKSPSGMTDAEFEQVVAQAMALAMPTRLVSGPPRPPFPTRRIVWHVNPVVPRGVEHLVVNVFDGGDAFASEEQVVDNSAPRNALEFAIQSMTSRLAQAMYRHDSQTTAYHE